MAEVASSEFTWRGCFIVLMFFTINLTWEGVYKCLGVLLPTLRDQFITHTWVIGVVTSLMGVGSAVSGLLAQPMSSKFGKRKSLLSCTVALNCGLVLISMATNPIFIALPVTGLVGFSSGVIEVFALVLMGRHFTKHFSLACGIAHTGAAFSLFIFAPLTQFFLDTYGWRGAVLLIAALCCHSIPCAMLIRDQKEDYDSVPDRDVNEQHNHRDALSLRTFFIGVYKKINMGVLLEFKYWAIFCCRFGATFSNSSWLIYYVPHLEEKGFSPNVAASLCSAAAVGYLLGTFIWSPFIDRGYVRCTTALIVSSLMLGVSFIVDPWVNTVLGYVFVTFLCGLFLSALFTLTDILTNEFFEVDRLSNAYAWIRVFLIVPQILAGFVPGWLFDACGSYDEAFIILGCIPIASLLPLLTGLIKKIV